MRSAAAAKGGDAIVGDPVLEVQRLRRLVSAKEEENSAILDLQKQMQAQLREAVQRADAAEAAAAKATERATRAEADLAEAGATVEDLAHQLETRDDDALRLERELAQAKHNAADAAAAAGEAASHARVESAGLMQAEARAASAELRADKLAAATEVRGRLLPAWGSHAARCGCAPRRTCSSSLVFEHVPWGADDNSSLAFAVRLCRKLLGRRHIWRRS